MILKRCINMPKKAKKDETEEKEIEISEDEEETADTSEEATEAEPDGNQDIHAEGKGEDGERKPKGRKEKKAVKKRKSSKEKENPLARAVRMAVETGKVGFGAKTGVKDSLLGKAKLIVISRNAPPALMEDIIYYCKLSEIPMLVFEGTSVEFGSICGKPYPASVLSIYDAGRSDILELAKKK